MCNKMVFTAKMVNKHGDVLSEVQVMENDIVVPENISKFGFTQEEQLELVRESQQRVLEKQAAFLNERCDGCPFCGSKVRMNGSEKSLYKGMYTDHSIRLKKWCCSSETCAWQENPSIKSHFGNNISQELLKAQAELGAKSPYREAAGALHLLSGKKRKINNPSRIHRTTNAVGKKIEECISKRTTDATDDTPEPAKVLHTAVDGTYVHDAENSGHNYEVMIGKIYKPENLVQVGKKRREIKEKHCAGSAMGDHQETMKARILEAAKREGLTKETTIIGLADGAKNCWNIIESLRSFCMVLICILDWFHIGKYVKNLTTQLPQYEKELLSAKDELWFGRTDDALTILNNLKAGMNNKDHIKKVDNFYTYINENRKHIINYDQREKEGLIYTSHVAESTVEHYVSPRLKKHQKMQWKRVNAHGVLQIRASMISGEWDEIWESCANDIFKNCA